MKPSLPKGTRDFLPIEIKKREFIFDKIRYYFRLFGYDPIETPAMESLETLMGKYGDEGDRLLFKILNNGDFLAGLDKEDVSSGNLSKVTRQLSKRGLRYDLTVPFARYIVMNRQHIKFPFKRSAIQPVWRADKPQKGRYQEFFQCDADVAGSTSLYYEAELIRLYDSVFDALQLPVIIRCNNRKILFGIVESAGLAEYFQTITVVIDKLDKIGIEGVTSELKARGYEEEKINILINLISKNEIQELVSYMISETGKQGIDEMNEILAYLGRETLTNKLIFDPTLARGLSYYTGCILEVNAVGVQMGSIGGGGRYDNLTAIFGLKDVSGVGISFGVERIYDVMEELKLFPDEINKSKNILIACLDRESFSFAIEVVNKLRSLNIPCDLYPDIAKLQKQMSYANDVGFAKVGLIGEEERTQRKVSVKDMDSGKQELMSLEDMMQKFKCV